MASRMGLSGLFRLRLNKSAGVAILFNNNFDFKISKAYTDPEGRFIICDLITSGKKLTLANIYAPNEDDPSFLTSIFDHLFDFQCEDIILGGDFNLVLNQ